MLHFCVCPKHAYCSCVCHGHKARLHILPSILDFLCHELFFDFPSFYGLLPLRLGFVWLWAFLHSACSFALFCSLVFPAVPFCYSCCDVIWPKPARLLWAYCLFFPQWLGMVIGLFTALLASSCVLFISSWASLAHLLSLGFLGPFPNFAFPYAFY